ncbi:MAG: hypothetical protein JWP63_3836 [Candidatus Solibacter sp.]|nr:hypothetical protein [Candidatus Solibacter sp.]
MTKVKAAEPVYIAAPAPETDPKLQLYVVYTDRQATTAALKTAAQLVRGLRARIVLLVAYVVPYPLPLENPDVPAEFTTGALSQLAGEHGGDVSVQLYLCRDREQTVCNELRAASLVVIGRRTHWWSNRTPPLARILKREGHDVILAAAMSNRALSI